MKYSVLLSALVLSFLIYLSGCGDNSDDGAESDGDADADADSDADADTDTDADDLPETGEAADDYSDLVRFDTTMGSFVIGLFGNAATTTVANFLSYVDEGFYTGKIFHRVLAGRLIQGGGFDESMEQIETHAPIALEIVDWIKHEPGVISMARTQAEDSATSQFFICVNTESSFDGSYAAFGEIVSGYDVVEAISEVVTGTDGAYDDVPVTPITINSAARVGKD